MHKIKLMEVARRELGMTPAQAEHETVITLREKIRRSRAQARDESDPLAALPHGLDRMNAEARVQECLTRGLDPIALPGQRGQYKTRPQMILLIREDVELRTSTSQTEPPPTARTRRMNSAPSRPVAGDWVMATPR